MIGDAGEHFTKPSAGIDVVEFAVSDQRIDCCSTAATRVAAAKTPDLSPDCDGAHGAFGGVVAHANAAVVEDPRPILIGFPNSAEPASSHLQDHHSASLTLIATVIRSRSLVTISGTKANKRLFFQLERTRAALAAAHGGRLPANAFTLIAQTLGVTETSVETMSNRMAGDQSCDAPLGADNETPLIETLASNEEAADDILIKSETIKLAVEKLNSLSERERHIISARVYTDAETVPELADLAAVYNVTPQRMHQIQKSALAKIRDAMNSTND